MSAVAIRKRNERNEEEGGVCFRAFVTTATTNQIESCLNNGGNNLLLSPVLILFQDRHFAEVKALQTRLDEHQDKNKTLTQVNGVQREQLETAEAANKQLNQDIQRLTSQWEQFSQHLKEKESNPSHQEVGGDQDLTTHQTVGSLWREVLDFRRQMITVKVPCTYHLYFMILSLHLWLFFYSFLFFV